MNETTKHAPGTFCWPELSTSDPAGAKKFYSGLFGWGINDVPAGPMIYTIFTLEGKDVAAGHQMDPQQAGQGIPPHWLSYVSVASAENSTAQAQKLGAKVVMGPFDVMDHGRMSVLLDPTGAAFALWEPKSHIGARFVDQPGTLVWTELLTNNVDIAGGFYTKLLGWGTQVHDMGPMKYTVFMRGETPAAGMMQITPDMGKTPPNWTVYFGTTDPDASAKKAGELGGAALMPPSDIPNVGRFAVLQDPQGAAFGIIRFNPRG
jgi:predicted enzyme related to lactoylglutathione lyase